jgi:hypothetical protein
MNKVATFMLFFCFKCQLDLVLKKIGLTTLNFFWKNYVNIDLANEEGANYSYAKIVREATLTNKRSGVMPLAHTLKFNKKKLCLPHQLGARNCDWGGATNFFAMYTVIVPRGWYSKSVVSVLTSQIHSETEMTNSVTRFKNCQSQTVLF